jgi:hypothetical protein
MTQLSQLAPSTTLASQIITAQDGTTATSIALMPNTRMVKISSVGNGVLIRFGAAPTTSNNGFSQFVVSGGMEYFSVPVNATNVQVLAINTSVPTQVTVAQF